MWRIKTPRSEMYFGGAIQCAVDSNQRWIASTEVDTRSLQSRIEEMASMVAVGAS